ncbi:MAG: hypothetical protein P9M14_11185 [Candidatus Alcyoniella australis]|nr:hypothetical protein [Candidatus Alcyoniella australis]
MSKTESLAEGDYDGWQYTNYVYPRASGDLKKILKPLIEKIKAYDKRRLVLQQEGGSLFDLGMIAALLSANFELGDNFGKHVVSLTKLNTIKTALISINGFDLSIQVRQLATHMPVYYLCRIHRDYWSEYGLIVEDLYISPDYPMHDDRFVKLMSTGHETYYLRLAQFRERMKHLPAIRAIKGDQWRIDRQTDELLYLLGRHVFQAAWHEDQRLGVLAARHFNMPCFQRAIELLYLCLSGELCELRAVASGDLFEFFEKVYRQPAIVAFMACLKRVPGSALNDIPRVALRQFSKLGKAFSAFLRTEVVWGSRQTKVPLHKLVFANVNRMHLVAGNLGENPEVRKASTKLETQSRRIIDVILDIENDKENIAKNNK